MSKNVIVVTNSLSTIDSHFSLLYRDKIFNILEREEVGKYSGNELDAAWAEIVNDHKTEYGIKRRVSEVETAYDLYRVPNEGFVYMLLNARKKNLVDDRNLVVCIKEPIMPQIYRHELYHMVLDGKFVPSTSVFDEFFNYIMPNENSLLSSQFDEYFQYCLTKEPTDLDSMYLRGLMADLTN